MDKTKDIMPETEQGRLRMKIVMFLCVLLFFPLLFASCKSSIENNEPIETKIDSLKLDRYGDTTIVKVVFKMRLMDGLINDFKRNYRDAKKIFDIWNDPSMYNYSNYAWDKRNNAYKEMQIASIGIEATEEVRKSLLDTLLIIEQNQTGKLYGWRVCHKFRCKSDEGKPELHNCVYYMDKKCEKSFWSLDEEEWSWIQYVNYIDNAFEEAREKTDNVRQNR